MKRYEVLDGMRGVAALCVLIGHASLELTTQTMKSSPIAVDIFFMLSGFVIAHSYGAREISFLQFMKKRLIRLYPMFLIGLGIGIPIFITYSNQGRSTYTTNDILIASTLNAFYLPYLNKGIIFKETGSNVYGVISPVNGANWSLIFEIVANMFFLAIWHARKHTFKIVLLSLTSIIAIGLIAATWSNGSKIVVLGGSDTASFITGFPRVFYGFALGIFLYQMTNTKSYNQLLKYIENKNMPPILIWIVMCIIFYPSIEKGFGAIYYILMITTIAPILVITGSACSFSNKHLNNICYWLGWLSYPIYCVHIPIMHAIKIMQSEHINFAINPVILVILVSITVSYIFGSYIDEPLRKLANKLLLKN